ncbi:hypothetical protein I4F81_001643 [Pyropia yezoensis]|uniref:Uncharacterized protein n=1 Tax=Pyropia yezoensis TaxID=2788 RepID=A0ACC3BMA3_PYRYE|nr:hypothetical protein I4F81_001643 [Neopyropia yezoensis]
MPPLLPPPAFPGGVGVADDAAVPAVAAPAPPVSRQLQFVTVDPLESEAIVDVTADHGLGVRQAAAAESRRASALRASIDQLEEVYAAVTAPDERERRRLVRAALKTRRVPVPSWALPGGTYWPAQTSEADERRFEQLFSLGWSPESGLAGRQVAPRPVPSTAGSSGGGRASSGVAVTSNSEAAPLVAPQPIYSRARDRGQVQQGGALMLALTGLAAKCAHQLDEALLFSVGGAHALLEHLAVTFDAPPAVKLSRATSDLHACTRGNGTVAAYVVKFRTAAARCASARAPLPDVYLGGLLLRNAGLSHEQQVVVQVTASASAHNRATPPVLIATVVPGPSAHFATEHDGTPLQNASKEVLTATSSVVGDAIIDPGATAAVAGVDWLSRYLSALPDDLRATVVTSDASVLFRFGDEQTTLAREH